MLNSQIRKVMFEENKDERFSLLNTNSAIFASCFRKKRKIKFVALASCIYVQMMQVTESSGGSLLHATFLQSCCSAV